MVPNELELFESTALRRIRERTPARLFVGRCGAAYHTGTQLELRAAQAAAADAVRTELDIESDLGHAIIDRYGLFEVQTAARDKAEYLRNPELGRRFDETRHKSIREFCEAGADLQIAIGDGLSVTAVATQVPKLLPLLMDDAQQHGWNIGQPFVIRYCRVGIMNEIGDLLRPKVVVVLIGERPGMATAESLSAYLAYKPKLGDTDAQRNLISNIHERGIPAEAAAQRIVNFAARLTELGRSGASVKEQLVSSPDELRMKS